jgi:DNA-directed RNA polymerase subunit RPC12/RpoP
MKHQMLDGPTLTPAQFPFAQSEFLWQAPPRCDRCHEGLWRETSDGYVCRTCSRQWLVQEKLRDLVWRQREHTEAWPVRVPVPAKKRS